MLNIKSDDYAQTAFNSMKLNHTIAYITFKITKEKNTEIVAVDSVAYKMKSNCDAAGDVPDYTGKHTVNVTSVEDPEEYRDQFIADLKSTGEPRFCVIDYNHKLLFVSWVPDTSKAMHKMKYASIKESFIQELVGVQIKLQATDDSELNRDLIAAKCKSNV
jgi:hypothetical protein